MSWKFTPYIGGRSTRVLQTLLDRALGRCFFERDVILSLPPRGFSTPSLLLPEHGCWCRRAKGKTHCPTSPLYSLGNHYYHDSPFSNLILINGHSQWRLVDLRDHFGRKIKLLHPNSFLNSVLINYLFSHQKGDFLTQAHLQSPFNFFMQWKWRGGTPLPLLYSDNR